MEIKISSLCVFFWVGFQFEKWIKCLFALLGQQDSVDVGQDTSSSDGDSSEQLVQFLVVLYGKGDVTGHDTRLLVVTSSVSCKFQNLSAQVLQDGSKVYWGSGSHAGGVLSLTEVTTDTTDRELQTCLGRRGCGLLFSTASLSFSFSCSIEGGTTNPSERHYDNKQRYKTLDSSQYWNVPDMIR